MRRPGRDQQARHRHVRARRCATGGTALAVLLSTAGLPAAAGVTDRAAETPAPADSRSAASAARPVTPLPAPAVHLRGPLLAPELPPPVVGPRAAPLERGFVLAAVETATTPRTGRVADQRRRAQAASAAAAADKTVAGAAHPAAPASLAEAVARIPGSQAETAHWVSRAYAGRWGATDWYANTIYISPRTPPSRLYSVVVHEWSHLLQVRAYDGDVGAAVRAMNRHFGGTGVTGAERGADCMTLLQGGTWTNYTSCSDPDWRQAAQRLLRGQPL